MQQVMDQDPYFQAKRKIVKEQYRGWNLLYAPCAEEGTGSAEGSRQWAAGSGLVRSLLGDYTSSCRDESRKTRPVHSPHTI